MKLLYLEIIETCIEAKSAYDAFFSDTLSKEFIDKFSKIGKVVYNEKIGSTYFRIIVRGKYTIKGFINSDNFRIMMADNLDNEYLYEIKQNIENITKS